MLYLDAGNTAAALENFRMALEKNPAMREAQIGIVRALTERKEFQTAQQALAKARQMGLSQAEAALMQSTILSLRATYRLDSAGDAADLNLCSIILAEDLDPAIALLKQHADDAPEPAAAYDRLGDLLIQKSKVQSVVWNLHRARAAHARSVGRDEEAAAEEQARTQALSDLRSSQRAAMDAYQRAIELDPGYVPPRLAVASHLLSTYVPRPEAAKAVLEPVIKANPDHRRALLLLAQAESMLGNYEEALKAVDSARSSVEDDFTLLRARGQILEKAGRWDELLPLSARLVALRATNTSALYLRGIALLNAQQPDAERRKAAVQEAVNHLQRIFRKPTNWPQARLALAQGLRELGNLEQARSAYRRVLDDIATSTATTLKEQGDFVNMAYEARLALYQLLKDDDPTAAAAFARGAFQARPDRREGYLATQQAAVAAGQPLEYLEQLALVHVAAIRLTGDVDAALAACEADLASPPMPGFGREVSLMRARLLAGKGNYVEAAQAYEELRRKWPDRRASLELAALRSRLGRPEEAQAIYEEQVEESPGDLEAVVPLVALLARQGKMDEARALLAKVEEHVGPAAVQSLLLALYLDEGEIDQAISLARSRVESNPQEPAVYCLLGELYWLQGDLVQARASFDTALSLDPGYVPAYRRALIDLQEGDFGRAADLMRDAQKLHPEIPAIAVQLAVAQQAGGDPQAAADVLQAALASDEASAQGGGALHWYLAVLYAALGEAQKAHQENQAVTASELGPRRLRDDLLDRVMALEPEGRKEAAAALNLLVVFSRSRRLDATVQQVDKLQQVLPDHPLPLCLQAELLDGQRRHDEAVQTYHRVIAEHPDSMFARMRLAESHLSAGEAGAAIKVLEDALAVATPQQQASIHLRLGLIRQGQGQVDAAMADYRDAMADPALRPSAANNLAWLLVKSRNDLTAALPLAQEAAEATGYAPEIADTLGWIHYLSGDVEKALPLLERARSALAANPTVRYHLGMAYLKAGRPEDARAELREALAISQNFPEAAEASRALSGL